MRSLGTSPVAIEPPKDAAETQVTWHRYGPTEYSVETSAPNVGDGEMLRIDICGLGDDAMIAELADSCGLSDLAIADLTE